MEPVEILRLSLRYVHLLGMAALIGGFAVQAFARQWRVNTAMVWGILIQLVTGILLAAPLGRDEQPSPAKLAVKLLLALMLAGMILPIRKKDSVHKGHFLAIGGVAAVTVAVATFWH